jgi:hypothetical protein
MANLCPHLLTEVDTFYQLGCGDQPKGSMGDLQSLSVERNGEALIGMLERLFTEANPPHRELSGFARRAFSQAHYSLALIAYGAGNLNQTRRHLLRVVSSDLRQLFKPRFHALVLRSLLNRRFMKGIKNFRNWFTSSGHAGQV